MNTEPTRVPAMTPQTPPPPLQARNPRIADMQAAPRALLACLAAFLASSQPVAGFAKVMLGPSDFSLSVARSRLPHDHPSPSLLATTRFLVI